MFKVHVSGVGTGRYFLYVLRHEKTGLRGFRPGLTQTVLCSYRRWLEARNLGCRKRDCTIRMALISTIIFAFAKCWFSHDVAHKIVYKKNDDLDVFDSSLLFSARNTFRCALNFNICDFP